MSIIPAQEPENHPIPLSQHINNHSQNTIPPRKKGEHSNKLPRHKTLIPGSRGPEQTHNLHPPSIPTIQNPQPIQYPEKTIQDIDKRLEIRLRNIITRTHQDHNLDITQILLIQPNILR